MNNPTPMISSYEYVASPVLGNNASLEEALI